MGSIESVEWSKDPPAAIRPPSSTAIKVRRAFKAGNGHNRIALQKRGSIQDTSMILDLCRLASVELSLRPMRIDRHSRLNSSMMLSMRNLRPAWVAPDIIGALLPQ